MKKIISLGLFVAVGCAVAFASSLQATQPSGLGMGGGAKSATYGRTINVAAMPTNAMPMPTESETGIRIDPDYPNGGNISYNVEALNLSDYMQNKKSSILKIKCDASAILKTLGLTNKKIVSIGIQEGDFTFSYDFNNCSFWASKINYVQATDVITDADAIIMAKDFLAKNPSLAYYRTMVGEPIILYRNNYDLQGTLREGKSFSTNVVFPLKISGKSVYQSYGDPLGLTMEVNNKGVNSANASLLPFVLIKADSFKLSVDDLTAFIKKGGNNPYYPPYIPNVDNSQVKVEVTATSYDKVWIMTYKYPSYGPGLPTMYLTSGIRIRTDQKLDNGPGTDKRDYAMVVSDYKVGNNNSYGY